MVTCGIFLAVLLGSIVVAQGIPVVPIDADKPLKVLKAPLMPGPRMFDKSETNSVRVYNQFEGSRRRMFHTMSTEPSAVEAALARAKGESYQYKNGSSVSQFASWRKGSQVSVQSPKKKNSILSKLRPKGSSQQKSKKPSKFKSLFSKKPSSKNPTSSKKKKSSVSLSGLLKKKPKSTSTKISSNSSKSKPSLFSKLSKKKPSTKSKGLLGKSKKKSLFGGLTSKKSSKTPFKLKKNSILSKRRPKRSSRRKARKPSKFKSLFKKKPSLKRSKRRKSSFSLSRLLKKKPSTKSKGLLGKSKKKSLFGGLTSRRSRRRGPFKLSAGKGLAIAGGVTAGLGLLGGAAALIYKLKKKKDKEKEMEQAQQNATPPPDPNANNSVQEMEGEPLTPPPEPTLLDEPETSSEPPADEVEPLLPSEAEEAPPSSEFPDPSAELDVNKRENVLGDPGLTPMTETNPTDAPTSWSHRKKLLFIILPIAAALTITVIAGMGWAAVHYFSAAPKASGYTLSQKDINQMPNIGSALLQHPADATLNFATNRYGINVSEI